MERVDPRRARGSGLPPLAPEKWKKWTVCLSSNSCLDEFPTNHRTEFINTLPETIHIQEGSQFYLRLCSIAVGTNGFAKDEPIREREWDRYATPEGDLYDDEADSSYLKVHISELGHQYEGREFMQYAGGFHYPPPERIYDKEYNYVFHEFVHTPYLWIKLERLNRLKIQLCDTGRKYFYIGENYPTFIQAEIMEKPAEDEFTIVCSSLQRDIFTQNTLNRFTVPLPQTMQLSNFEVALLQLRFPEGVSDSVTLSLTVNGEHTVNMLVETLFDTADTVKSFNGELQSELPYPFSSSVRLKYLKAQNTKSNKKMVSRWQGGWRRQVALHYRSVANSKQPDSISVTFNKPLANLVGLKQPPRAPTKVKKGEVILFDVTYPTLATKSRGHFAVVKPAVAVLRCDIVKSNNMMTGSYVDMLQMVPLLTYNATGEAAVKMYEPRRLSFQPITDQPFNSISFEFVDPDTGEVTTMTGTEEITTPVGSIPAPSDRVDLTLLFRRKKRDMNIVE